METATGGSVSAACSHFEGDCIAHGANVRVCPTDSQSSPGKNQASAYENEKKNEHVVGLVGVSPCRGVAQPTTTPPNDDAFYTYIVFGTVQKAA